MSATDAETEVVDAEVADSVPPSSQATDLVRYATGSTEIIKAESAREKLAIAREVANCLNDVIVQQGMRTKTGRAKITGPDGEDVWVDRWHVNVEGWQTLATLLGIAIDVEWTRRVIDPDTGRPERVAYTIQKHVYAKGTKGKDLKSGQAVVIHTETAEVTGHSWEARVLAIHNGVVVGSGEAMCSRAEQAWRERDDFALRSMASTRATSRAVAAAARWIVTLAGYSGTTAEDAAGMPGGTAAAESSQPAEQAYEPPPFATGPEAEALDAEIAPLLGQLVSTYGLREAKANALRDSGRTIEDKQRLLARCNELIAQRKAEQP